MKANAVPLLGIFEKKMRLEVPLFQRQYVWNHEHQWAPLWEDVERKFSEYLNGRKDAPVHFLGAMVLDQKLTPTTHVEKRQVIDGQQRLTTLQIFLAAFRDFCREQSCEELASECKSYTFDRGMMADPDVDRFKVWPTRLDQPQFKDVISSGSRVELVKRHPLVRRKYARQYDHVHAWWKPIYSSMIKSLSSFWAQTAKPHWPHNFHSLKDWKSVSKP